jgi:SNF2 family DNA or RNA helicase
MPEDDPSPVGKALSQSNIPDAQVEINRLETELLLAELTAKSKRDEHAGIVEERKTLKASVTDTRNEYAQEQHAVRLAAQLEIERLQNECQEKVKDAEAAAAALATPEWDASKAAREAEALTLSLQRQLDQAKRALLQAAEWATLETRWDLMTAGAHWREWSKDHQISGAKKITYEGRLILGDTMGLGKTLTSIIALDMIEAATQDASSENPIQFGKES